MTGHPPPVDQLPTEKLMAIWERAMQYGNMLLWSPREKDALRELRRRGMPC